MRKSKRKAILIFESNDLIYRTRDQDVHRSHVNALILARPTALSLHLLAQLASLVDVAQHAQQELPLDHIFFSTLSLRELRPNHRVKL